MCFSWVRLELVLSEGISAVRALLTHPATQCWTVELGDLSTVETVPPCVMQRRDIVSSSGDGSQKKAEWKFVINYSGLVMALAVRLEAV